MSDMFNNLMEIIGAYEILNNLIPGAVYIVLIEKYTSFRFLTGNVIIDAIIFYFSGLLIGRIGSAVIRRPSQTHKLTEKQTIERIWGRIRSLMWAECNNDKYSEDNYDDYIIAEKKDAKISRLSLIGDMYRTLTSVCFCIILTIILNYIKLNTVILSITWIKTTVVVLACIIMALIFRSSYIKQAYYIRCRVKKCKENKE